jgi:hypothetical protein
MNVLTQTDLVRAAATALHAGRCAGPAVAAAAAAAAAARGQRSMHTINARTTNTDK